MTEPGLGLMSGGNYRCVQSVVTKDWILVQCSSACRLMIKKALEIRAPGLERVVTTLSLTSISGSEHKCGKGFRGLCPSWVIPSLGKAYLNPAGRWRLAEALPLLGSLAYKPRLSWEPRGPVTPPPKPHGVMGHSTDLQ